MSIKKNNGIYLVKVWEMLLRKFLTNRKIYNKYNEFIFMINLYQFNPKIFKTSI